MHASDQKKQKVNSNGRGDLAGSLKRIEGNWGVCDRVAINKQLMKGEKQKTIQKQAKQAIQLGVNHAKSQHKITSQNELNKTENLL